MTTRSAAPTNSTMPTTSEEEAAAEVDEPPDNKHQMFTKSVTRPVDLRRTESLLTRAFHTDSESHDDDRRLMSTISHNPSVSSTCSNFSGRSAGDFTSDDGHTSPGTRASTPSSPRATLPTSKYPPTGEKPTFKITFPSRQGSDSSKSSQAEASKRTDETTVEAELGRRRCISFACGRKDPDATAATKVAIQPTATLQEPPKRQCAIKFLCPSRVPTQKSPVADTRHHQARLHSPAPPPNKSHSPRITRRGHRDSDATIKNESSAPPSPAVISAVVPLSERRMSNPQRSEATRFHEFASSDDEVEDWIRESTCHRSRLTVTDTLKKENVIRKLAEEAEEEAMEEEQEEDDEEEDMEDTQTDFFSGEEEDAGFQTDDEEGFAASDDDSDDDSDYEWWAPRRSTSMSPFIPSNSFRSSARRNGSDSTDNDSPSASPKQRPSSITKRKIVHPLVIKSNSSELPDSTDFVCGTLDEDRPLEQAFLNNRKQREAAKHRPVPQDIDPTFPTSDPDFEKDDDEEVTDEEDEVDDVEQENASESDEPSELHEYLKGGKDYHRGRGHHPSNQKSSPSQSLRRLRSPPAPAAKRGRSPAPRGLFSMSPNRCRSPPPPIHLTSPPPSRRGSAINSLEPVNVSGFSHNLLGARNHELTHTSSLPRSPNPFSRRRRSSNLTARPDGMRDSDPDDDDETEGNNDKRYTRSAIDIVQGLEHKRLKRREKLYKQYWKREEKKKNRRPQPGKGAERMKQVGIECANYRGTRMISL